MKFSYVVLNEKNEKLTGILAAQDEPSARKQLHTMGLSVVVLHHEGDDAEITPPPNSAFVFLVVDKKGKEARGTIEAVNRKMAFYRLVSEYGFRVLSLCDTSLSRGRQEEEGKEGLERLGKEIEEEFGIKINPVNTKEEKKDYMTELFLEQKEELEKEVNALIERTEDILVKFENEITGDEKKKITKKIDELLRMRLSNNIAHIQNLADELLTLVDEMVRKNIPENEEEDLSHILEEQYRVMSLNEVHRQEAEALAKENENEEVERNMRRVQQISGRLKGIMNFYNDALGRKRKPRLFGRKENAFRKKMRLLKKTFQKILLAGIKVLFAKNPAVRHEYIQKMRKSGETFRKTLHSTSKALEQIEQSLEKEEVVKEYKAGKIDLYRVRLALFFEGVHVFLGFIVSFYVVYFYFFSFFFLKTENLASLRALSTSFPYLTTGIFFIAFTGSTGIARLCKGHLFLSILFLLLTAMGEFIFLSNFGFY